MLEIIKFESLKKGKNLLVLGSVHGNETCGSSAILRIINQIKTEKIKIESGSITFIPFCNLKAFKENKRFIDINLNRVFKKINKPVNYEEKISQKIIKYIDKCDYLLDIHSMPTDGTTFAFLDKNEKNIKEFVEIQNFQHIMIGWNDLFGEDDNSSCGYGFKKNKICATIECGNHNDFKCVDKAEISILNSMSFLKIANCPFFLNTKNYQYINMEKVIYKTEEGILVKKWKHLDIIKKGEIIAKYNSGAIIKADDDYLIILPHNDNIKLGNEWFYLGKFI